MTLPPKKPYSSYRTWIQKNYPYKEHTPYDPLLAVTKMANAYPLLTKIKGYISIDGFSIPHHWLITKRGKIIDPTVSQFGKSHVTYHRERAL